MTEHTYPWLRLLDMEAKKRPPEAHQKGGPGRPPSSFPRKRVNITLTDDETAALDELTALLGKWMDRPIYRGHLIAFMAFWMRGKLQAGDLPDTIRSFSDLAERLDCSKGGSK